MKEWQDIRNEIYTEEEIRESDIRVSIMEELIKARNEQGILQRELEQLSWVKQQIISRMEWGMKSQKLNTVLKVLVPLGKTLIVVSIEKI